MTTNDPNVLVVELAAHALEPLLDELVLVGGCAVGLLITDESRPPIRHTIDVDLLAEVTTKVKYYQLSERLRALGFVEDTEVICRFNKDTLIIDVMPTDDAVLGFGNIWYEVAAQKSSQFALPSGRTIRHVSGPFLLATKLEAFNSRGNGDYTHHDIEDIVNLVDGRPELLEEVSLEQNDVREYIRSEIDEMLADRAFTESIPHHFHPSEDHAARVALLIGRLRALAGL
jgi:hypothetical protein